MLQFSWNGTMLQTDVMHYSYIPQYFFAPCNFFTNSACYVTQFATVLHYMSVHALRSIYKGNLNLKLKSKILEKAALPVLNYGAQHWP